MISLSSSVISEASCILVGTANKAKNQTCWKSTVDDTVNLDPRV